jgi:hypothetical protein
VKTLSLRVAVVVVWYMTQVVGVNAPRQLAGEFAEIGGE